MPEATSLTGKALTAKLVGLSNNPNKAKTDFILAAP
jgi:hypothetical protein